MSEIGMQKTFTFELVSPERKLMSGAASMVVIPGTEGDFGVLPGHMSLVAAVRPGVVSIWKSREDAPERVFITGGFADVTAGNCTLLAEEAVRLQDLNADALEQQARNLRDDVGLARTEAERAAALSRLEVTTAKLQALAAAH